MISDRGTHQKPRRVKITLLGFLLFFAFSVEGHCDFPVKGTCQEYYPDGKLYKKIVYKNGTSNGIERKYCAFPIDGIYQEYYPNGRQKKKLFIKTDRRMVLRGLIIKVETFNLNLIIRMATTGNIG